MTYMKYVSPVLSMDEVKTLNDMCNLINHMNKTIREVKADGYEFPAEFVKTVREVSNAMANFNLLGLSFETEEA